MKKGIGKSHSKIILIGEHSVVYGYPAIAIPLKKIGIECIVEEAKSSCFHNKTDTLSVALFTALKYLKKENAKIKYKVTSQIPPKRGMGSSAAVSIAAMLTAAEEPIPRFGGIWEVTLYFIFAFSFFRCFNAVKTATERVSVLL